MRREAPVSAIESTVEQIEAWLIAHLAARRGTAPQTIDARERFSHYGLDSLGATRLLAELAQVLGRSLSPTLLWEHPTIAALARPGAGAVGENPLAHQPCLGYCPEKFSTLSLCNNPLSKDPLSARSRWESAFASAEMGALVSFASTVILR